MQQKQIQTFYDSIIHYAVYTIYIEATGHSVYTVAYTFDNNKCNS